MIAITGGLVVDGTTHAGERQTLLIDAGKITARQPVDAPIPPGAERFDARNRIVIPGLVNAHTHGHGNLMKGMGDRWTLELSLTNGPWLSGARDPEQKYLSALAGAAEMLAKGTTACYDLVYEHPVPTVDGCGAIAQAYADAGIRAIVSPMIADRSFYEAIPGLAESLHADIRAEVTQYKMVSTKEILGAVEKMMRGWSHPRERVAPA